MTLFLSLLSKLHMGGYAAFVWSAYGCTFCVFLFLAWRTIREKQQAHQFLQNDLQRTSEHV